MKNILFFNKLSLHTLYYFIMDHPWASSAGCRRDGQLPIALRNLKHHEGESELAVRSLQKPTVDTIWNECRKIFPFVRYTYASLSDCVDRGVQVYFLNTNEVRGVFYWKYLSPQSVLSPDSPNDQPFLILTHALLAWFPRVSLESIDLCSFLL